MIGGVRLILSIAFRGTPAAVKSALSADLAFLAPHIHSVRGTTRAQVEPTPEQSARIVAWGRTRVDGGTLAQAIRLDEHFERSDLEGQTLVELTLPLSGEMPQVIHAEKAYVGRWTCPHCDRVELGQRSALAIEWTEPPRDLELTASGELLVRQELEEVFRQAGIETRPVQGRDQVRQVMVGRTADLDPSRFPLSLGRTCPGCGRATIDRSADVVGSFQDSQGSGLWVSRVFPLTIGPKGLAGASVAAFREPLEWNGLVTEEARHVPGELFDMSVETAWTSPGIRPVFVRAELLRHLFDRGATQIPFRTTRAEERPAPTC